MASHAGHSAVNEASARRDASSSVTPRRSLMKRGVTFGDRALITELTKPRPSAGNR